MSRCLQSYTGSGSIRKGTRVCNQVSTRPLGLTLGRGPKELNLDSLLSERIPKVSTLLYFNPDSVDFGDRMHLFQVFIFTSYVVSFLFTSTLNPLSFSDRVLLEPRPTSPGSRTSTKKLRYLTGYRILLLKFTTNIR